MVSVRTSILEDLDAYPRTSRRSRATPSTAKSRFSVDGRDYEIDLSNENADKLHEALAPFVNAARQIRSAASPRVRRSSSGPKDDLDLTAVREWARANGHNVSDRGRVPGAVLEAYAASRR
ncbi:Lsr2 family protein [Microbacterium sp.]|uniref:histone-like nucleoid-structuring protein Lsr2 n=1 Tax=Microbacterium sp. TaxID=51671 RepID=UPI00373604DB